MKEIIIAGGCFWGVEAYFNQVNGITFTKCVYVNGNFENPTYEDLKSHNATHAEGVYLTYDDNIISTNALLELFLRFVDPFSIDSQGEDFGHQYRSGLYPFDIETKLQIDSFLKDYFKEDYSKVKFEIVISPKYYDAEEYHQNYLNKHPNGYCHVNLDLVKDTEKKN